MSDSLGDRMKRYELASHSVLTQRMPVIIRVDGKAFHTYASNCEKPFDDRLSSVMVSMATKLCQCVQGAQLAYTQSDEVSLLVHGYKRFNSESYFNNQLQKIVSVVAGTASAAFTAESWKIWWRQWSESSKIDFIRPAVFDARAFVIPESDVNNYFLWRQQDAQRNSVQQLARSMYSHHECDRCNVETLKEMCAKKGTPWQLIHKRWQRGVCIRRGPAGCTESADHLASSWRVDDQIPLFNEDPGYVNDLLKLEEER